MKQLLTEKPKLLRMIEVEPPQIAGPHEVLIKMKAAGICGSDVHIYHGTSPVATYPRVMGHEIVGVVAEIGKDVSTVKVGDPVIVDQITACGECYPCSIGRPNICCNLQVRGVHIDGGYREYMTAPEDALHILPENLAFTDAVMIEPMSIAFQSCARAEITKDDRVFILGAGALGKSLIKAVLLTGAEIIVSDVVDQRLAEAQDLGVKLVINSQKEDLAAKLQEYTRWGPTVSIDAAGFTGSLPLLTELTCNAGRVITMAFLDEPSPVQQFKITAKELDIRGSRLQNNKFKEVIAAYNAGKIKIEGAVSHVYPFADAIAAFERIDSGDPAVKKIALAFD
ncbi:MAG: alcohol dehydrogenase catalytic domain-containing protein [Spirochaetaceae bacterium]|jgi:L-gulonate 5-dehydrogenase|nr:alcohol dehydrogenase catalytic domain-containing protein [Spirochaetaceae bacterium]